MVSLLIGAIVCRKRYRVSWKPVYFAD